jgi:acyl-CoA thioester hydrolase
MAYEFEYRRRIDFHETDMAGIVHFSNFFRFMESAEHAFFRSLGLSLHANDGGTMHGWARVHASCDYLRPAHYQDLLAVRLRVTGKTATTLAYALSFHRVDEEAGAVEDETLARGVMKVVCITRGTGEDRIRATRMPADVDVAIEVADPA